VDGAHRCSLTARIGKQAAASHWSSAAQSAVCPPACPGRRAAHRRGALPAARLADADDRVVIVIGDHEMPVVLERIRFGNQRSAPVALAVKMTTYSSVEAVK
jgi:hypothetical protein